MVGLVYLGHIFFDYLYHIGHCKVHNVVSPSQLKDGVRSKKVVALEQTSAETLVIFAF